MSDPRLHLPVYRLTLAFCLSLAAMQLGAYWAGLHIPTSGHTGPLWHLNILVGVGVAVYWCLRRIEGDFRALFLTALSIFVASEALSALAHAYGIGALRGLSGVFRHTLLVFSSLALTAGSTDLTLHSRHERIMFAACGGFLFLSILHLTLEFLRTENDAVEDIATAAIAFAIAAFAAFILYREKSKIDPEPPEADSVLTPENEKRSH